MIGLADPANRSLEIVRLADGEVRHELTFEVFQAPGFQHQAQGGGLEPHAMASGDVNGDDSVDLIVSGGGQMPQLIVYLNDGSGSFSSSSITLETAAHDIELVDLDGDGARDIVIAGESAPAADGGVEPRRLIHSVIARSEATRQSSPVSEAVLGCFAALALTVEAPRPPPRLPSS